MITENAKKLLRERYLMKNEQGEVIETISEMWDRVATVISNEEETEENRLKYFDEFYRILSSMEFVPNSPALMNSGLKNQYLSACNVLPIDDDMEDIFETVKQLALVNKAGAGTGFAFSRLRPRGDKVGSTGGVSSGVISFMRTMNEATNTVKQGGRRKGANMGVLRVDHPDIMDFISAKGVLSEKNEAIFNKIVKQLGVTSKEDKEYIEQSLLDNQLSNFNISAAVTDKFMKAVENKEHYSLINPRNNKEVNRLYAPDVWDKIIEYAYKNGEPGIIFLDTINKFHPVNEEIESVNVCGEQPLLPYESCTLGAVNLSKMLVEKTSPRNTNTLTKDYDIDWGKLGHTVRLAVRFLDNAVEANVYPLPELEEMAMKYRKIGVGIMG